MKLIYDISVDDYDIDVPDNDDYDIEVDDNDDYDL